MLELQQRKGVLIFNIQYLTQKTLQAFLDLDRKVYADAYCVSEETTLQRLKKNPYTDLTIMDGERLVGYLSLCPVDQQTFKRILSSKATEEEVERHVMPYDKIGTYHAYLSSIVIDKEEYPKFPGRFLFIALQNHLKLLQKRGIWVDHIIAVAVSAAGRKTLIRLGFKETKPNVFIYSCLTGGIVFIKERVLYAIHMLLNRFIQNQMRWGSV